MNRTVKRVTALLWVVIHWGLSQRKPSFLLLLGGLSGQGHRNTCLLPCRETLRLKCENLLFNLQVRWALRPHPTPVRQHSISTFQTDPRPVSRALLLSAPGWIAVSCYREGTKEALASWLSSHQIP